MTTPPALFASSNANDNPCTIAIPHGAAPPVWGDTKPIVMVPCFKVPEVLEEVVFVQPTNNPAIKLTVTIIVNMIDKNFFNFAPFHPKYFSGII
jgi:hypothetical protein